MSGEKTCFVIGPISQEGTEMRDRSDKVLKHVIEPVVLSCGYSKVIRADPNRQSRNHHRADGAVSSRGAAGRR